MFFDRLGFHLLQEFQLSVHALSLASVLSPKTWPFDLSLLPQSAYLVGGSVRDALLGRQAEYLDLDFVLPETAIETAQTIASHYQAGFVILDAKHKIARVVFDQATVDFAQQTGLSLHNDLRRRDFTVNAIAYHPHSDRLLDPLHGGKDLQRKQLRMISIENLREDPLRLLRAYRQAAQLGFTLEPNTQEAIRELAPLLAQVAAERVRGELDSLLSQAQGTPLLNLAWQDGLLKDWLPHATDDHLKGVAEIDRMTRHLERTWPTYAQVLKGWLREQAFPGFHRSWLKAAKLCHLLSPDVREAEAELERLKYSRVEQQAVIAILRGLPQLHPVQERALPLRQQYFLFRDIGSSFLGLSILVLALGAPVGEIAPLINRFLNPEDPVAHPTPLITGRDLMRSLGIRPGPQVGKLLASIQLAQAEGKVSTATEALRWAAIEFKAFPHS